MAKTVDFNTLKKHYLPVTLRDEAKTKLLLTTPRKKVLEYFIDMKDSLQEDEDDMNRETIDELYEMVALLLSHNKTGKKIEKELVDELFDYEDIAYFIQAYTDFILEVSASKN